MKPYDVRIVCEGKRSAIDAFLVQIRLTKYPIEVKDLAVRFEPATGEYAYFEIKRGDMAEELGERLDLANTRMTEMKERQDVMLEKQDRTIDVLTSVKGDTALMLEKQDETITVIKEGGEKTREALKGRLEEEIAGVKYEIIGMKTTLNRVTQKVGVE